VEKYEAVVIDAGRNINDEVTLGALHASSAVFLVMTQELAAVRNAQRFLSFLMRMGFSQDQLRIVVNHYVKKHSPHHAALEQIRQTLNQEVFYGIPPSAAALAAMNRGRPFVADRQAAGDLDRVFRAFVDKATGRKEAVAKPA
jgi:Flp pilus assembly CpaE family ATPase